MFSKILARRKDNALKIIGAGGLARELFSELLDSKNLKFSSINFVSKSSSDLEPYPHLRSKWLEHGLEFMDPKDRTLFLVAIGNQGLRKDLTNQLLQLDKQIGIFISPRSYLSNMSTAGKGTIILSGVNVSSFSKIGNGVLINPGTTIAHDVNVGNYASLGPGVRICGNVFIGEEANLGAGCVVLPGIRIGKNSTVGAGAVVTKNVDDCEVVAGVPAVKLSSYSGRTLNL